MGYGKHPIYHFTDSSSLGISTVPDFAIVCDKSNSKLYQKLAGVPGSVDTIADLIAEKTYFEAIGAGSGQMLGAAEMKVFSYNAKVVDEDIVISSDRNASAIGPVEILEGFSVTISDEARLVIL